MIANFVHNPWLTRRLKRMLEALGFAITSLRSHGYVQTEEPAYMLTLVDRGAEILVQDGTIGAAEAESLRSEARLRVASREFFGYISFLSFIARAVRGNTGG